MSYDVTINWTTGVMNAYRNGMFFGTITLTTPSKPATGTAYFGCYQGTANLGLVTTIESDPRIYNRALSAEEVWELYQNPGGHEINDMVMASTPVSNSLVLRDNTGEISVDGITIKEDGLSQNYGVKLLVNSGIASSDKTLTLDTVNTNRILKISGDAELVAGVMVPTTRTVAGKALSANVTLDTLTLASTATHSSVTSSDSYNGSAVKTLTIFKPDQSLSTTNNVQFASVNIAAKGTWQYDSVTDTIDLLGV